MDEIVRRFKRMEVDGNIETVSVPKMPKGKRTAYICFTQHHSSQLKAKGQALPFSQLSKYCSQRWKEVSAKEKEKFVKMANEDNARYKREMDEFDKQKKAYDSYIDVLNDQGILSNLGDQKNINKFLSMGADERQKLLSKVTVKAVPKKDVKKKTEVKKKVEEKAKEETEDEEEDEEDDEEEDEEEEEEESGEDADEEESEPEDEANDKGYNNRNPLPSKGVLNFDETIPEEDEEKESEKSGSDESEAENVEPDVKYLNDNIDTSESESNEKVAKKSKKKVLKTKKKEVVNKTVAQKGGRK